MKKNKFFIAALITFVYFTLHLAIINDYGLSWDFHYHFYGGLYHLGLPVPKFNQSPPVPFTPPDPRLTVADPFGPIMSIVPVITYKLFYERLHIFPFDSAYNLASVVYGSVGVGILFLFLYETLGFEAAIVSAIFLALLPNYFGYLHTNMKDVPDAVLFALSVYLFWRLVEKRRVKDLMWAAMAFALAFNIKINSIFIPVVCLVWYLFSQRSKILDKKMRWVNMYFVIAPLGALILWSVFWRDPFGKLWEIIPTFSHNTLNMPVLLYGNIFHSGVNIPIYYPYLYLAITTPLPILITFVVGLGVCIILIMSSLLRSQKFWKNFLAPRKLTNNIYLLLLLWFFVPLARFFSPQVGAIDGVRHFMEIVFPFCTIAGLGAVAIYRLSIKYVHYKLVGDVVGLIVLWLLVYNIVHFHPYQTSYFNSLVGGIKGANGKFDIDFWGTPQKEGMIWLNKNAARDSSIDVVMAQASAGVYLRADLRKNLNAKSIWESDYVVILNRQSFFTQDIDNYLKAKTNESSLVYSRKIDNVPLVWIFKNRK